MENQQNKRLIVIAGPTAVGKTAFAIKVAQHLETEIISCDSRQLYRELKIGVSRPSPRELSEVKHHFIGSHSIHQHYDAGSYARDVNTLLTKLFVKYDTVVMTGGTGLYIKAATEGLDKLPKQNAQLRQQLSMVYQAEGISAIQDIAKGAEVDPEIVDFQNPQRLMRAIEIASTALEEDTETTVIETLPYDTSYYYLDRDRTDLYNRINYRVEQMLEDGFEHEAKSLYAYRDLNALKTVGYKEFFEYFDEDIDRDEAILKMKQRTRNYAKRQLTWFRNQGNYQVISTKVDDFLKLIT